MKWNQINSENSKARIEEAYNHWLITDKKSIRESSNKFKTSPTKVKNFILSKGHRLESHNINIFENIDTEEKAYWLGFLYADGSVGLDRDSIELSLKHSDSDHLEKFKKFLDCTNPVHINSIRCRITVGSKKIREDLIKWGCTPKKSFTIRYPERLEAKYNSAFIRGFFDGDGSITRNCKECLFNTGSICSASKPFLEDLLKILKKECDLEVGIYKISQDSNTYVVIFSDLKFRKLLNYIFFNSKIHLDRKYERYLHSTCFIKNN